MDEDRIRSMGSGGSKQKKAAAVGEFSASYQRNKRPENERRTQPQPQVKQTQRQQSEREPELQVVDKTDGKGDKQCRRKRQKPKVEKVDFPSAVLVDFTNSSTEDLYVFVNENGWVHRKTGFSRVTLRVCAGKEKQCVAEIKGESNGEAKLPSGGEFVVKDLTNDVYFHSVANCNKICFLAASPITDPGERSGTSN